MLLAGVSIVGGTSSIIGVVTGALPLASVFLPIAGHRLRGWPSPRANCHRSGRIGHMKQELTKYPKTTLDSTVYGNDDPPPPPGSYSALFTRTHHDLAGY